MYSGWKKKQLQHQKIILCLKSYIIHYEDVSWEAPQAKNKTTSSPRGEAKREKQFKAGFKGMFQAGNSSKKKRHEDDGYTDSEREIKRKEVHRLKQESKLLCQPVYPGGPSIRECQEERKANLRNQGWAPGNQFYFGNKEERQAIVDEHHKKPQADLSKGLTLIDQVNASTDGSGECPRLMTCLASWMKGPEKKIEMDSYKLRLQEEMESMKTKSQFVDLDGQPTDIPSRTRMWSTEDSRGCSRLMKAQKENLHEDGVELPETRGEEWHECKEEETSLQDSRNHLHRKSVEGDTGILLRDEYRHIWWPKLKEIQLPQVVALVLMLILLFASCKYMMKTRAPVDTQVLKGKALPAHRVMAGRSKKLRGHDTIWGTGCSGWLHGEQMEFREYNPHKCRIEFEGFGDDMGAVSKVEAGVAYEQFTVPSFHRLDNLRGANLAAGWTSRNEGFSTFICGSKGQSCQGFGMKKALVTGSDLDSFFLVLAQTA
jgi:hypothetical protein